MLCSNHEPILHIHYCINVYRSTYYTLICLSKVPWNIHISFPFFPCSLLKKDILPCRISHILDFANCLPAISSVSCFLYKIDRSRSLDKNLIQFFMSILQLVLYKFLRYTRRHRVYNWFPFVLLNWISEFCYNQLKKFFM